MGLEMAWKIWGKIPGAFKWVIAIIIAPNMAAFALAFWIFIAPWVRSEIHAVVIPLKEQRDIQIKYMEERGRIDTERAERESMMMRQQLDKITTILMSRNQP